MLFELLRKKLNKKEKLSGQETNIKTFLRFNDSLLIFIFLTRTALDLKKKRKF